MKNLNDTVSISSSKFSIMTTRGIIERTSCLGHCVVEFPHMHVEDIKYILLCMERFYLPKVFEYKVYNNIAYFIK